jgi:hypothetical protein
MGRLGTELGYEPTVCASDQHQRDAEQRVARCDRRERKAEAEQRRTDEQHVPSRRAERSAPATEPTAIIDVKKPNLPAPAWNALTAIVEMKIGKLMPNVPIKKKITSSHEMLSRRNT